MIVAGTRTKVYYAELGGFDTHATQEGKHKNLLKNYSAGVAALVKDLKQYGKLKDTLIMTFSEFGRRVKQNGSGGTDHGTANNLFLISESIKKPGIYNDQPNLTDLDKGDLKFKVDFREVYTTVLDKWLEADAKKIIGKSFSSLPIV